MSRRRRDRDEVGGWGGCIVCLLIILIAIIVAIWWMDQVDKENARERRFIRHILDGGR